MKEWIMKKAKEFCPKDWQMFGSKCKDLIEAAMEGESFMAIGAAYNWGFQRGVRYAKKEARKRAHDKALDTPAAY